MGPGPHNRCIVSLLNLFPPRDTRKLRRTSPSPHCVKPEPRDLGRFWRLTEKDAADAYILVWSCGLRAARQTPTPAPAALPWRPGPAPGGASACAQARDGAAAPQRHCRGGSAGCAPRRGWSLAPGVSPPPRRRRCHGAALPCTWPGAASLRPGTKGGAAGPAASPGLTRKPPADCRTVLGRGPRERPLRQAARRSGSPDPRAPPLT